MVPLHIEGAGSAAAVAFERQAPDRLADPGGVVVEDRGRAGRDQPAGEGGARFGLGEALAQKQAGDAAGAGAQRQTAAGGEVEKPGVTANLDEDRGEAATAEAFLAHPQGIERPGDAHHDQASRVEAETGEADAIGQSALAGGGLLDDPQKRAIVGGGQAGKDGDGETGRGGGVADDAAPDFVECVAAVPATQGGVDGGDAQGQERAGPARGEMCAGAAVTSPR
jgi:hypothetical protein